MNLYYSRSEVAKMLHISESKVYRLASEGLIRTAPNPHKIRREALYEKAEVDQLAIGAELYKDYLNVKQISKLLNVKDYVVRRLITKHNIPTVELENSFLGVKKRLLLSTESVQLIKQLILATPKISTYEKSKLYNKDLDIAYMQLFEDKFGSRIRVSRFNDLNEWGFMINGQYIEYKKAIKEYHLKHSYDIHKPKLTNNKQYTEFTLSMANEGHLHVLDFFYSQRGIENIIIQFSLENQNELTLQVAAGIMVANTEVVETIGPIIQHCVSAGAVTIINNEIFLQSSMMPVSTMLPYHIYTQLFNEAELLKVNVQTVLTDILTKHYSTVKGAGNDERKDT